MEQSVTSVIMIMLVVFVFIPALFMGMLGANRQKINEAMYLSSKCLIDCVETTDYSLEEIAHGYGFSEDPVMRVRIDEAKLFTEFDNLLFANLNNAEQFAKVRNNIVCEMLIYPDRYVVWNKTYSEMAPKNDTEEANGNEYYYSNEKAFEDYLKGEREKYISAPKYFVYKDVGLRNDGDGGVKYEAESPATIIKTNSDGTVTSGQYYINAVNDKIRKVGTTSSWRDITTNITDVTSNVHYDMQDDLIKVSDKTGNVQKTLSRYDKNQVIIDTLNREISKYTGGVMMDFINPASVGQKDKKATKQDFNFFTGITFLVIYKEDNLLNIQGNFFTFNQYTAAGCTLEN